MGKVNVNIHISKTLQLYYDFGVWCVSVKIISEYMSSLGQQVWYWLLSILNN